MVVAAAEDTFPPAVVEGEDTIPPRKAEEVEVDSHRPRQEGEEAFPRRNPFQGQGRVGDPGTVEGQRTLIRMRDREVVPVLCMLVVAVAVVVLLPVPPMAQQLLSTNRQIKQNIKLKEYRTLGKELVTQGATGAGAGAACPQGVGPASILPTGPPPPPPYPIPPLLLAAPISAIKSSISFCMSCPPAGPYV